MRGDKPRGSLPTHSSLLTFVSLFHHHHVYVAILYFYLVNRGGLSGGHADGAAVANVEFGAVSWAGDRMLDERAFAERAVIVRADVVDAVKVAAGVNQNDDVIIDFEPRVCLDRERRSLWQL